MGSNVNLNSGHHQYHQPVSSGDEDEDSSKDGSLRESADIGDGDASNTDSVWGDDVTCAFTEALTLYPPCGRRKIILSDEGKMYGRNELIARYIKIRTGKTRTRKQVSSHIQVLARRKARENQSKVKGVKNSSGGPIVTSSLGQAQLGPAVGLPSNIGGHLSDASTTGHHAAQAAASIVAAHHHHSQSVAAAAAQVHHSAAGHPTHLTHVANAAAGLAALGIGQNLYASSQFWQPAVPTSEDIKPFCTDSKNFNGTSNNNNNNNNSASNYTNNSSSSTNGNSNNNINNNNNSNNNNNNNSNNSKNAALLNGNSMLAWQGRSIASSKCRLIEFSAYADTGTNSGDRHLFVQIGPHDSSLSNSALPPVYPLDLPMLEGIDISQIYDKFPPTNGLKDLFERGPTSAFFLVKFWADLSIPPIIADDSSSSKNASFYGIEMLLEGTESTVLTCTTSVCSFGRQVVQRVDTITCTPMNGNGSGSGGGTGGGNGGGGGTSTCNNANSPRSNNANSSTNSIFNNSNTGGTGGGNTSGNGGNGNSTGLPTRYIYRLGRTEMCEYMVNFILKLKDLPEKYMMNSVLENFTILQVISNKETGETLLCIAFVFEVSVSDNGAQHHTYRLVRHD